MELNERFFINLQEYNDFAKAHLVSGKLITIISIVPITIGFRVFYTENKL